jgi:hypothetical protein
MRTGCLAGDGGQAAHQGPDGTQGDLLQTGIKGKRGHDYRDPVDHDPVIEDETL